MNATISTAELSAARQSQCIRSALLNVRGGECAGVEERRRFESSADEARQITEHATRQACKTCGESAMMTFAGSAGYCAACYAEAIGRLP